MGDNTFVVNMKVVGDISDARSNIDALQKSFSKLKLPDKIGDNLGKKISEFYKEYDKYQKKISEGIKTQGDYNQVEKSLNRMRSLYQEIGKEAGKVTKLDLSELIDTDIGDFKKITDDIQKAVDSINKVKIDPKNLTSAFDQIKNVTKNTKIVGKEGILGQLIGHLDSGEIDKAKQKLGELEAYAQKVKPRLTEEGARAPGTLSTDSYNSLVGALQVVSNAFDKAEAEADPFIQKLKELQIQLEQEKAAASKDIIGDTNKFKQQAHNVDSVTESLKRLHEEEFNFNREAQNIDRQIQSYFGLSQMIRKVGDIARDAFATVKELDAAMTQTAVVTNFSVGDMWDMLPTYTAQANQLGSTIKDVYEAATLYYQQGLNTNQAMGLANETLKMARIAGLGAAEATDMMTAALRGFNMEINQQSAQKINDIYSELAAITASDTAEIGSAMERTASIANSANMEFATTSAFLAQMIETTREAPENLGTAMKTIIARFQEMKQDPTKLIDSEGVAMDANKVDKALKTIGVNLMNTKGEFRDLDDVFLDISQRWDSLTQGQQRYIATIAAGSRQQSRFIAMMSNYERTMELVDAANNSAGASQRQFEKTLDSMEAKLNKLKNAWDQFTMGLMNNQIIKLGVDALTKLFTVTNKIIDVLGSIPAKPFEGITKSALTLVATLSMLNFGKKAARGMVMGGAAWYKGEQGGFTKNFAQGFKGGSIEAQTSGNQAGITWAQAASRAINSNSNTLKGAMHNAFAMDQAGSPQAIEGALRQVLQQASIKSEGFGGWEAGDEYIEAVIDGVRNGKSTLRQAIEETFKTAGVEINTDELIDQLEKTARAPVDPDKLSTGFEDLTKTASSAGDSIRDFGYALQGTPLEGFGNTLIRIGNLMDSTSKIVKTFSKNFSVAMKAAGDASGAGGKASAFFGNMFPNLTKIIGLIGKLPIQLKIIAAVLAVVGAIALKISHDRKKALESATDAAAKASEAYDSAKQETSELADSIEQIQTNEDAFKGLVVGTAAFNEQLVVANQQITELLNKYPMLNNAEFLSTDKNGLMHINQQGLDKVKEYQKQKQANASALNLIQAADLNSVEVSQKTAQMRKTKGTDTLESLAQRKKEADLLDQQAKAQSDMAKVNAVSTALVDKEIHNREKVSAILADQYDARKEAVNLEGQSIHDLKQQYADFYGYKYDKSTKKMTDTEGNEIEVDKQTVKDAVQEMTVITSFEADGKSLDSMLNSIDSKFSDTLGSTFEDSGHLFSDILSDNIDINDDLIKEVLQNPQKLQEAVNSLSEKEIAAVLGVSADAVAQAPDQYKDELTNKLTEKATNIAETQAQSYTDLASMLAQTVGSSFVDKSGEVVAEVSKADEIAIKEQLSKLSSEQKNNLSSIGKALEESAGADTMRTFVKQAADIYVKGSEESISALDSIIQDVNWSSPTARLKAYNDMINSADTSIQTLGKDLRNSSESSNLLGEAFEEFYDSSDFQDMAENMDKFANASGELDASSINNMAKECNSLNNLLDTGAISAGGVAAALNAMGRDGNITILDLNENLLKFLSTANQLQDVLSDAHSLIENFDWGVDTGESEDFAIDSTKKWKELYDNGEFGNQQLENYAKFVLGQERWNDELEKAGGNIETALTKMDKDISVYSDGFMQAWRDMADSGTYKEGEVGLHRGENNDIIWETQGKTTQELVEWLAETRGITQEWAKLMIEDFANYSYDFKTELQANDFAAALKSGDYIEAHKGADNTTNITQSEIATLAAAQNKTEDEILADIQKYGKISEDELNVIKNIDENGNLLMGNGDIASLNTQYSQAELGKDTDKSWLTQYKAQDKQGQVIEGSTDLKNAISGAIADGFQAEQATEMARAEAYQAFKDGAQVFYDGVELNEQDLADSQAFADKIAEITENSRWNAVGEAIAQGYISYIKGNEDPSSVNPSSDWGSAKDGAEKTPSTPMDWGSGVEEETALRQEMREKARENWSQLWQSIKEGLSGGTPTEDPKTEAIQRSRENWKAIWEGVKTALSSTEGIEDPKIEAAEKAKENWKSIWENVKKVFSTTPEVDIDPKTNGGAKQQEGEVTTAAKGKVDVTYTGEIANSNELKASLEQQITSLLSSIASQQSKMTATATLNVKQGKVEKPKQQTATVNYAKGKQAKADNQTAQVNYTLGQQAAPKPKSTTVNYTLGSQANPSPKTVDISPHFVGSWEKTIKLNPSGAKGINNNISSSPLPSFGSAAKGHYGTVGPKNKGGLTLTGEEGFEIAWLPSESKSMIVGADGPQLLNLPADAVVYTHEQSKKIIKQKSIPMGSHAGRHDSSSSNNSTPASYTPRKGNDGNDSPKPTSNQTEQTIIKVIEKAGTVLVWWENVARRMDDAQRKSQKTQKNLDKMLKVFGTSVKDYEAVGKTYKTQLENIKSIAQEKYDRANTELKYTDQKYTIPKTAGETKTQAAAKAKLDAAKKELAAAKKKDKKKSTKKTKTKVTKAKAKVKSLQSKYNNTAGAIKDAKENDYMEAIGARQEISYTVTKKTTKKDKKGKKKTTTSEETKKEKVNLSKYITTDKNGVYILDQAAIADEAKKNKSKAQAIKEAAEKQLNDLLAKQKAAEDELAKAQEEYEKFLNDTYDTFYAWDKSITEIYFLGKELEKLGELRSMYEAATDVEFAKLTSGIDYDKASNGLQNVLDALPGLGEALEKNRDYLMQQAQTNYAKMNAAYTEYINAITGADNLEKYRKAMKGEAGLSQNAKNEFEMWKATQEFLRDSGFVGTNFDISAAIDKFNKGRLGLEAKTWKAEDYDKIKQGLDKIAEKQADYYNAITETYSSITEIYNTIEEYQSYLSDFENSLIKGIEEEATKEINQLNKINTTLSNAAKELLDEVKRKLDERRKQEDNAKTERDISQKQQRLAALQADTSGGHQVEIAQLQKEITESQQGYTRTLEDQLLDRLSQQQDEAAKQRERQISLMESQRDLAVALGSNVEEVNQWLTDPKKYYEQIRTAWLSQHGYDEAGAQERKQLEEQFVSEFAKFEAYGAALPELMKAATSDIFSNVANTELPKSVSEIEQRLDSILEIIPTIDELANLPQLNVTPGSISARRLREAGFTVQDAVDYSKVQRGSAFSFKELWEGGYSAKELYGAGYRNAADYKANNISYNDAKNAGFSNEALHKAGYREGTIGWAEELENFIRKTTYEMDELTAQRSQVNQELSYAYEWLRSAKQNLSMAKDEYAREQAAIKKAKQKGGNTLVTSFISGGGNIVEQATNQVNEAQAYINRLIQESNRLFNLLSQKDQAIHDAATKRSGLQFKKGGLANYTGPAWLDGTPSKPELVLNSTDTKNFIALKDILNKAMGSTSAIEKSYDGDTTFEININVDHLNNDYDVDKVAERVKKIIIKDSNYRNVTQVRKFR